MATPEEKLEGKVKDLMEQLQEIPNIDEEDKEDELVFIRILFKKTIKQSTKIHIKENSYKTENLKIGFTRFTNG